MPLSQVLASIFGPPGSYVRVDFPNDMISLVDKNGVIIWTRAGTEFGLEKSPL